MLFIQNWRFVINKHIAMIFFTGVPYYVNSKYQCFFIWCIISLVESSYGDLLYWSWLSKWFFWRLKFGSAREKIYFKVMRYDVLIYLNLKMLTRYVEFYSVAYVSLCLSGTILHYRILFFDYGITLYCFFFVIFSIS